MKKARLGAWYLSVDLTFLHGYNVLLGFNYVIGEYAACRDNTMTDCIVFDYSEFQIGFLIFTLAIGKDTIRTRITPNSEDGTGTEDSEQLPDGSSGETSGN